MYWDTHMHTHFSGDSQSCPQDMITAAIEKKLAGICFTDHMDFDYPGDIDFTFQPDTYMKELHSLKEQFASQLPVRVGIELGLQPHLAERHRKLLQDYDFDFVIGSSHLVHGKDPYYPQFFEGRIQEEAYHEYFKSILENIQAYDDFDVYGHLDYVVRYGPTRNEGYTYEMYREIIDSILRTLIERGKGIELNMGGFKYGLGHPNPCEEILFRYRELGGEILTLGSDAHAPQHVGFDFHRIHDLLTDAGFRYYTVFQNRKGDFYPL